MSPFDETKKKYIYHTFHGSPYRKACLWSQFKVIKNPPKKSCDPGIFSDRSGNSLPPIFEVNNS